MTQQEIDKKGALPDTYIEGLIAEGSITGASADNVNPASLDLSLSSEIYRTNGMFLPKANETVRDLLPLVGAEPHSYNQPLERNIEYVARLNESAELPEEIYGYCNPKSSTGRNGVLSRVLADRVQRFDAVTTNKKTELWVAIVPKAFPVRVNEGETLSQLRLFNKDTRLNEDELAHVWNAHNLMHTKDGAPFAYEDVTITDRDGSILLTVDIAANTKAYRAKQTGRVFELSKGEKVNAQEQFFEEINTKEGTFFLKAGGFYILTSKELVTIPPDFACEMVPMDERSGELRAHYAGFIDPGWGWNADGDGTGRPLTLEVCPFEDVVIRDGQPIAKIRFEHMIAEPDEHYDAKKTSHYSAQSTALLSKHVY